MPSRRSEGPASVVDVGTGCFGTGQWGRQRKQRTGNGRTSRSADISMQCQISWPRNTPTPHPTTPKHYNVGRAGLTTPSTTSVHISIESTVSPRRVRAPLSERPQHLSSVSGNRQGSALDTILVDYAAFFKFSAVRTCSKRCFDTAQNAIKDACGKFLSRTACVWELANASGLFAMPHTWHVLANAHVNRFPEAT